MLSEFYFVTEDFESVLKECSSELVRWSGVHYIQRYRMSDLAQDMLGFREGFVRAHINATMWTVDSTHEAAQNTSTNVPEWKDIKAYVSGDSNLEQNTKLVVG